MICTRRKFERVFLAGTVLSFLFFFQVRSAAAQTPPPSGSSAEVLQKKTREEAKKYFEQAMVEQPAEIEGTSQMPMPDRDISFELKKVILEGDHLEGAPVPEAFYQNYLNKTVNLRQLQEIMRRIEIFYRSNGYIAVVYLLPQEIRDGEVRLGVLISRMGKLKIEGTRYSSKFRLRRYWTIDGKELLSYEQIKNSIERMNQQPDRTVKAVLLAGEERGTTDVTLKVEDRFPVHLGTSLDNQGVKTVGKERGGV